MRLAQADVIEGVVVAADTFYRQTFPNLQEWTALSNINKVSARYGSSLFVYIALHAKCPWTQQPFLYRPWIPQGER